MRYARNKKYKLNLRLVCGVNLGRFPKLSDQILSPWLNFIKVGHLFYCPKSLKNHLIFLAMSSVFVSHQKLQNPILRLYKTFLAQFKTQIDLTSNNREEKQKRSRDFPTLNKVLHGSQKV